MTVPILVAHAPGEDEIAEAVAVPLRKAGYKVVHAGTVLVGDSIVGEYSKYISAGSPVVLCGTVKAVGTGWAYRVVNTVRAGNSGSRLFALQMERDAYVEALALDGKTAPYWQDSQKAIADLVAALNRYYGAQAPSIPAADAESRYRRLALESCDIIDLANLPEDDRHIATRQLELRRLYVSLRVRVPSSGDARTAEQDDLESLERARLGPKKTESDDSEHVGTLLAKSPRLVVLGDPGSGKTTMLRWIATAYLLRLNQDPDWSSLPDVATLPDRDWLPIIVRCRDLDERSVSGTLEDVLGHTLRKAELTEEQSRALKSVIKQRLENGTGLLLIDGLDEIADAPTRARFAQQIERIASAYPTAPIIATSRIVGYREMGYRIGRNFVHAVVSDLTTDDKDEFAKRWCAVTETPERRDAALAELIHDIHSTDRIEHLTGNPMLLTTMALVKRKIGRLPSRRADLYWSALHVLLNWRREVDEAIDDREAIPQLQYLAFAMCDRGAQQFRRDEVVAAFDAFKDEHPQVRLARRRTSEEFLQLLERRTGILVEAGHTRHDGQLVPVYEFRHLTFQEYLAGLALISGYHSNYDRGKALAERVAPIAARIASSDASGIEQWHEALRLCAASCNDADVDGVIRAIATPLPAEDKESRQRRAALAVLCLADEPNVSDNLGGVVIADAMALLEHGWADVVDDALDDLARSAWLATLRCELRTAYARNGIPYFANIMRICSDAAISSDSLNVDDLLSGITGPDDVACEACIDLIALIETGRVKSIAAFVDALTDLLRRARSSTIYVVSWVASVAREELEWKMPLAMEETVVNLLATTGVDGKQASQLLWGASSASSHRLLGAAAKWLDSRDEMARWYARRVVHDHVMAGITDDTLADRLVASVSIEPVGLGYGQLLAALAVLDPERAETLKRLYPEPD
jgi:NACHT domain